MKVYIPKGHRFALVVLINSKETKLMKTLKRFKTPLIALLVAGAFTACSSDDDAPGQIEDQGKLGIYAKATYSPGVQRPDEANRATIVELSKFLINIEEIELEYDEVIDGDRFYNWDNDIELKGPFEVDLLANSPMQLVNVRLPYGRLEEIEFEFDKSENPNSELYKQSMRMEGAINGMPFVFWHDFEDEIELEFDDDNGNGLVIDGQNSIVIDFNLNPVLDPTRGVDLSTAVDGNGDGVIEISPRDNDGNRALAEEMKRAIKKQIDILEDLYD